MTVLGDSNDIIPVASRVGWCLATGSLGDGEIARVAEAILGDCAARRCLSVVEVA